MDQQPSSFRVIGIDVSTQSCKIAKFDEKLNVLEEHQVVFDADLPEYGTISGYVAEGLSAYSFPEMWRKSVELCFQKFSDLGDVDGVCVSAQQHGTVYGLDVDDLLETESSSPIWMDTSTQPLIDEMVKDDPSTTRNFATQTGSAPFARFSAWQAVKRILQKQDDLSSPLYAKVHLVSSYITSLLAGRVCPIDPCDFAGTNLLDFLKAIHDGVYDFSSFALERFSLLLRKGAATEGEGPVCSLSDIFTVAPRMMMPVGKINRLSFPTFPPSCEVFLGSGDNPCTALSLGLFDASRVAISLGTSDTLMCVVTEQQRQALLDKHSSTNDADDFVKSFFCFPHPLREVLPTLRDASVCMFVFANGDKVRRHIRDEFFKNEEDADWDRFDEELRVAYDGIEDLAALPQHIVTLVPEIYPPTPPGVGMGIDFQKNTLNVIGALLKKVTMMHSLFLTATQQINGSGGGGGTNLSLVVTGGGSRSLILRRIFSDVFRPSGGFKAWNGGATEGAAVRALLGLGLGIEDVQTLIENKMQTV